MKKLRKVKFTPGRWANENRKRTADLIDNVKVSTIETKDSRFWISLVQMRDQDREETEANERLICAAPKMFWILVTRAEETGEQYLYDTLSAIVGQTLTHGDMMALAEHAHQILNNWHKEEKKVISVFELH